MHVSLAINEELQETTKTVPIELSRMQSPKLAIGLVR